MKRFQDKVVLITGGTSGIGMEIAKEFLQEGAKVVITGRDIKVAEEAIKNLKIISLEVFFVQADVSKASDCEKQTTETIKKFGRIDILVTSAGLNLVGNLLETSEEAWDLIMDVNLKGVFLSIKSAKDVLIKNKGAIVTISSDVALKGSVSIPVYSISKSGVLIMTQLLAAELAKKGVRINSVLPANIIPGMKHSLHEEVSGPRWVPEDQNDPDWVVPPLGRFGKAEEVAKAVLFLASDDASYCSGSYLLIDGALNAVQP